MLCFLTFIEFLCQKLGFLVQEDRPRIHRWTIKFLGRILIGLLTALIFWYLMYYKFFGASSSSMTFLLVLILIFCALSLAVKAIRCIFLLISLQFFGRAGRSAIKKLLFSLVIIGPVSNLSKNTLEINRVFVCSSELAYNLTKTHIDLMIYPFRAAINELQNASQVKESFDIVNKVIDPLVREIELNGNSSKSSEKDPIKISENYSKKLSQRCLEQMKKGMESCAEIFSSLKSQCVEKFPEFLAMELCWMMDIESICSSKIDNHTEQLCTPTNVLDDSFGRKYLELLAESDNFTKEIETVEINYRYNESNVIEKIREVDDYKNDLKNILNDKKHILDYLLLLMNLLVAFTYFKVVIRSSLYLYSYTMELDFENVYITSAFREIDENRAKKRERTLLPLKKIEKTTLVDPFEKRRMENDYRDLIYHLLKFLLELIAVSVFILLDWLLVTALEVVAANGEIDFTQKGEVEVKISVSGEGMMASVVGNIISGFSVNRTVENFENNEECLPNPSKLFTIWYLKIYGIFLAILLMIYNESYTNRMLYLICVFFYPLKQQERSLFLYNKILLSRRDRFRHMKMLIEQDVQENKEFADLPCKNLFDMLSKIFPSSRHCRICQEKEKKPGKHRAGSSVALFHELQSEFVECPAEECTAVYCDECWRDMVGLCVVCGCETGSFM